MTVIEWLLDSDPSIRWQVISDLTDASPEQVAAERAKVAREGAGARLLALQVEGGWPARVRRQSIFRRRSGAVHQRAGRDGRRLFRPGRRRHRLLHAVGTAVEHEGVPLVVLPTAERLLEATDTALRAAGLSASRLATLRRAAAAIASGALTEAMLEELPSEHAAQLLQRIKGIGPWTAAVILRRGLGRIDVLPGNDSGVRATLDRFAGKEVTAESVAEQLGTERGMAYFCLLLARLEARGEIGRASDAASQGR